MKVCSLSAEFFTLILPNIGIGTPTLPILWCSV